MILKLNEMVNVNDTCGYWGSKVIPMGVKMGKILIPGVHVDSHHASSWLDDVHDRKGVCVRAWQKQTCWCARPIAGV